MIVVVVVATVGGRDGEPASQDLDYEDDARELVAVVALVYGGYWRLAVFGGVAGVVV